MKKLIRIVHKKKHGERGFSLLEYCAGAAVILVTVWAALNAMGGNIRDLLGAIGQWASERRTEITSGAHQSGGSGSSSSQGG